MLCTQTWGGDGNGLINTWYQACTLLFIVECSGSFSDTWQALGFKYMWWSGFMFKASIVEFLPLLIVINQILIIFLILNIFIEYFFLSISKFYLLEQVVWMFKKYYYQISSKNMNYTIYIFANGVFYPFISCSFLDYFVIPMCDL